MDFNKIKNFQYLYNFIRMLDSDEYPRAYIEFKKFKIFFKNARFNKNFLKANVLIKKNEK